MKVGEYWKDLAGSYVYKVIEVDGDLVRLHFCDGDKEWFNSVGDDDEEIQTTEDEFLLASIK